MLGAIKIYILDDDRYFGKFVENALKENYSDVTYFQSEQDCISALEETPDILILDHKLEFSTGFEIIEMVQRLCGSKTNILYLSAQDHVHVTLEALKMGAVDYLEKDSASVYSLNCAIEKMQQLTNNFNTPLNIEHYRELRI